MAGDVLIAGHEQAMRHCLLTLDVEGAKQLQKVIAPHLPPVMNDADMLFQLHMTRTGTASIPLARRQYSHRWLAERRFGSLLPEPLWPKKGERE